MRDSAYNLFVDVARPGDRDEGAARVVQAPVPESSRRQVVPLPALVDLTVTAHDLTVVAPALGQRREQEVVWLRRVAKEQGVLLLKPPMQPRAQVAVHWHNPHSRAAVALHLLGRDGDLPQRALGLIDVTYVQGRDLGEAARRQEIGRVHDAVARLDLLAA